MYGSSKAKTPAEYIAGLEEPRKSEIQKIHDLIRKVAPGLEPYMESGMIGYGKFHYKYASGREGDWAKVGLASQKNYISIYCCAVKDGRYIADSYRDQLPKANIGKSCVRIKKMDDVDLKVFEALIKETAKLDFQM
jgi:hypothetical protein